jgi:2,4-dienoyl-CoA reductase-like NADH-dependent reductase (Old Yellow Enzyme family)
VSNQREDEYGGSFENRTRLPIEVAKAVREIWPEELPLFVRISSTDYLDNGWDIQQSIRLSGELKKIGVDFIDCSSGMISPTEKIPFAPGFQVSFAEQIKKESGIFTGAVGLITESTQADSIIKNGQADAVLLARQLLRDPYWPLNAARELGAEIEWPKQYSRAKI